MKAEVGPHALAATDTILAHGGRQHLTDWHVEVDHSIKETGLRFVTDAVLALPTKTSEVRLFEVDYATMSRARLAREVWDYEAVRRTSSLGGAPGDHWRHVPVLVALLLHPQ